MAQFPVSTSNEQSIHAALELSKNSWLLAIQVYSRCLALSGELLKDVFFSLFKAPKDVLVK